MTAAQVDERPARLDEQRETLFRCRQLAGQELALGAVELEREGERVAPLPAVLGQQRATPAARYVSAEA